LGLVWVLPGMVRHKIKPMTRIPFGPFLIVGLIIVKLFGASVIEWYAKHVLFMS
jgi:prepilin signal peptidase PulO-like enzyme (type II secretory pathway)